MKKLYNTLSNKNKAADYLYQEELIKTYKSNIGKRFARERQRLGYHQSEIAVTCATSQTTVSSWENKAKIPSHILSLLALKLDFDVDYILRGTHTQISKDDDPTENIIMVPSYEITASAGFGRSVYSSEPDEYFPFPLKWFKGNGFDVNHSALIRVSGDSMDPVLLDNDIILIDTSNQQPKTGNLVVFRSNSEIFVKFFENNPIQKTWRFISENKRFSAIEVPINQIPSDFKILGRVVWSSRVWSQ